MKSNKIYYKNIDVNVKMNDIDLEYVLQNLQF